MSLKKYGFCLTLAVIVGMVVLPAMAQEENKELVTSQDPFILQPPTTSLPQPEKVELPEVSPSTRADRGARPSAEDTQRQVERRDVRAPEEPERKTPKNVMRIDDKNKRKVQPVAVIKADLSPWGYTRRYQEGDIAEPEHPFGSGQGPGGIGNNRNNPLGRSSGFGGFGNRDDDDDDDRSRGRGRGR